MNIVEAYIKYKSQLIILISGLSGSGITNLGKNIAKDFKIKLVNYKDYIKPDIPNTIINYNNKDIEFVNMDSDEVIEWDKFLSAIKSNQNSGVVAISPCFFSNNINKYFTEDVHINVKLNKLNLVKKRVQYDIQKQTETETETVDNSQLINMIVNAYTFPFYIKSTDMANAKITKFINANEYIDLPKQEYDAKVYDAAFDYLIHVIQNWLDNYTKSTSNANNNIDKRTSYYNKQEKKDSYKIEVSSNLSTSEPESLTEELETDDTTYLLK